MKFVKIVKFYARTKSQNIVKNAKLIMCECILISNPCENDYMKCHNIRIFLKW